MITCTLRKVKIDTLPYDKPEDFGRKRTQHGKALLDKPRLLSFLLCAGRSHGLR